jgi:hypothetical protein
MSPPLVAGPVGNYLRAVARTRLRAFSLARSLGLRTRADGVLSGQGLGPLRLLPLFPDESTSVRETHWGTRTDVLVICPELYSVVVLRLWHSARSAREAYRAATQGRSATPVVEATGEIRWLPPSVLTPGNAYFYERAANQSETWSAVDFLRATADDMIVEPHPMSFVRAAIDGVGGFFEFRTFVLVGRAGKYLVPGGERTDALEIRRPSAAVSDLSLALGYREATLGKWEIWKTIPITVGTAIGHATRWSCFRHWLMQREFNPRDAQVRAEAALHELGILPEASSELNLPFDEPVNPLQQLARELITAARVG